ncbi:MAG: hypothetical protein HRU26_03700, partial [Psychroserpens sp.]|nr:hypothetical protein [Psychroserpens sp.]
MVLWTTQMHSQNNHFRSFTVEDGLPQSQINTMITDQQGYLWLGTNGGGMARFDGNTFKVFNESHGISSNYIYDIKVSKDSLFLATKTGLSIKYRNDIVNYETPQINQIRKFGGITYLLTHKGLFKYSTSQGIEPINLHPECNNSQIVDIVFDGESYWIGTSSGLWKCSGLSSEAERKERLDYNNYVGFVSLGSKIYASTYDNGTLVIEKDDFETSKLIEEPTKVSCISIQNGNELWMGTESEGIYVFDTETERFKYKIDQKKGLSSAEVKQIMTTSNSNIWIATSGGLYKYYQNNFQHYNLENGLKGKRVYATLSQDDEVYFSTSEKGLQRMDDFRITDVGVPPDFLGAKIRSISSDNQGNLWAGSDGKGVLFLKSPSTNHRDTASVDSLSRVFNSSNGFPFDWIRTIHAESDTIWAATYSKGIVKFKIDSTSSQLEIFKTYAKLDGIEDLAMRHMVKDDAGRFWYATFKGHLGYLKEDEITHKGQVLGQENSINSILIHKDQMFLGTTGNGIWYSEDFNSFRKLSGQKALPSPNIFQLIMDDQGFLWASSEKGVSKIELTEDMEIKDVFFFGRNEGFPGRQPLLNAIEKDTSGNLWFGTMDG